MITEEIFDALFPIEKSLRYHQRRRAFYDGWHKRLMFFVIIAGSASVPAASYSWAPVVLGFAVTIAGAIDLVASLSDRARDHEFLYRRFSDLLKEMKQNNNPSPEEVAKWKIHRVEIEADEPAIYWGVEASCYNESANAFGRNPAAMVRIKLWPRIMRNYLMFDPTRFQPAGNSKTV